MGKVFEAEDKVNFPREPSRKVDKTVIIERPREPSRTADDESSASEDAVSHHTVRIICQLSCATHYFQAA